MIAEGLKVLARRALPLTEVVRLAKKDGWEYLIVDGVNLLFEVCDLLVEGVDVGWHAEPGLAPDLFAEGGEISASGVARVAGVDRTFLYRHRDLLAKTHALQAEPAACVSSPR